MPIRYVFNIKRLVLRNNPNSYFVFGDNADRTGYGGQAAQMRGEPNAVGVATKWSPGRKQKDYFTDDDENAWQVVNNDLSNVRGFFDANADIVVPSSGIGTGLAELPTRAPRLYKTIYQFFDDLSLDPCPWPKPTN